LYKANNKLYNGNNKLYFDEMMMIFVFCLN
jgi:hypothetical protein